MWNAVVQSEQKFKLILSVVYFTAHSATDEKFQLYDECLTTLLILQSLKCKCSQIIGCNTIAIFN